MAKKADPKLTAYLQKAQAREDRQTAVRLARLKRALAGTKFFEWELGELERLVFAAFGRNKLGAHPQ